MQLLKEDFCNYKTTYNHIWWPRLCVLRTKDYEPDEKGFPWFWKYKTLNWIYRVFDAIKEYLFNFEAFGNWNGSIVRSFPYAFRMLWDNIMVFLTPWYNIRRKFLNGFINCNGSKLINNNRYSAYVRTRGEECTYYDLVFTGFRYKLIKTILRDGDGNASNAFLAGISLMFAKTDEDRKTKVNAYHEEKTKVCSGWVCGWKSAVKELNKIAYLTQNLEWFSQTEWQKNCPDEVDG